MAASLEVLRQDQIQAGQPRSRVASGSDATGIHTGASPCNPGEIKGHWDMKTNLEQHCLELIDAQA